MSQAETLRSEGNEHYQSQAYGNAISSYRRAINQIPIPLRSEDFVLYFDLLSNYIQASLKGEDVVKNEHFDLVLLMARDEAKQFCGVEKRLKATVRCALTFERKGNQNFALYCLRVCLGLDSENKTVNDHISRITQAEAHHISQLGGWQTGSFQELTHNLYQDAPRDCVICHDQLMEDCLLLQCCHIFHSECLIKWYQQKPERPQCPLCREHPLRGKLNHPANDTGEVASSEASSNGLI